jgi:hypothetical protein
MSYLSIIENSPLTKIIQKPLSPLVGEGRGEEEEKPRDFLKN